MIHDRGHSEIAAANVGLAMIRKRVSNGLAKLAQGHAHEAVAGIHKVVAPMPPAMRAPYEGVAYSSKSGRSASSLTTSGRVTPRRARRVSCRAGPLRDRLGRSLTRCRRSLLGR